MDFSLFSPEELNIEYFLVLMMLVTSLFLVAIAFERLYVLSRVGLSARSAAAVVAAARSGTLLDARTACRKASGPAAVLLALGLDRALGAVQGDPRMAMARERKRIGAKMRARTWLLATAGALMPFVGLFGTVLGVMSSFQAIGESGQGGFAVVSVGISQALIATAVGIAVALEGVLLFNFLQSIIQRLGRTLAFQSDELLEIILTTEDVRAGHAGK
ncbi:MAG: biopolymer transport protein ExbB/TolQ [Myxococcota bacterium]|jgi:biopolymer transport protein ExbB/TolQ